MSTPLNTPGTEDKPSREARFSSALWKLDQDWREQADVKPRRRPGRLFLSALLAILLYVLSAGPVGTILVAIGGQTGFTIWCCLYFPIVLLLKLDTPLAHPLRAYLSIWLS